MGHLDETSFESKLGPCPSCGATRLELRSMIDQVVHVMLADPAGAPRWAHDGEKFIDGCYEIRCAGCKHAIYESADCPRCHAPGALPAALKRSSALEVPRKCPGCQNLELMVTAMVPSLTVHAGATSKPKPLADFGDDGFHVIAVQCEDCGVIAEAAGCPICAAPGPLRARP
jgi:hypothetical protein